MTTHDSATHSGFEAAVLPLAPSLYGRAYQLCRDPDRAQDLVQDTFARAFRYWPSFKPGSNLGAWLRRILTNTFINGCRSDARARRLRDAIIEHEGAVRAEALAPEQLQFADEVRKAMDDLSADFRQVLMLVDVEGLSYADTAARIGCPVGTVMSRLHRARAAMRAELTEYARVEGYLSRGTGVDAAS